MMTKLRAVNLPGNPIGKQREALYRAAFGRIKESIDAGYLLEAITLCESIIADRLEARRAWIHHQHPGKRKFGTLGKLANELLGLSKGAVIDPNADSHSVYREVILWADLRNRALHEMVKLAEDDISDWGSRYSALNKVAKDGQTLTRKIGALLKKLNR